jgi:hypothetical protein
MLLDHVTLLPQCFPFLLIKCFFFFFTIVFYMLLSFFSDQSQFVEGPLERGLQRDLSPVGPRTLWSWETHMKFAPYYLRHSRFRKAAAFCCLPAYRHFGLSKESDCGTNNRIIKKGAFASTVETLLGSRLVQQDSVTRPPPPSSINNQRIFGRQQHLHIFPRDDGEKKQSEVRMGGSPAVTGCRDPRK